MHIISNTNGAQNIYIMCERDKYTCTHIDLKCCIIHLSYSCNIQPKNIWNTHRHVWQVNRCTDLWCLHHRTFKALPKNIQKRARTSIIYENTRRKCMWVHAANFIHKYAFWRYVKHRSFSTARSWQSTMLYVKDVIWHA